MPQSIPNEATNDSLRVRAQTTMGMFGGPPREHVQWEGQGISGWLRRLTSGRRGSIRSNSGNGVESEEEGSHSEGETQDDEEQGNETITRHRTSRFPFWRKKKKKKRLARRTVLSQHRSFCVHSQGEVRVIDFTELLGDKSQRESRGVVYKVEQVKRPPLPVEDFEWDIEGVQQVEVS